METTQSEERKSGVNEKQYLVRGPAKLEEIIERLCWEFVDGEEVKVKTKQQVIREAFIRGLQELQRERGVRI